MKAMKHWGLMFLILLAMPILIQSCEIRQEMVIQFPDSNSEETADTTSEETADTILMQTSDAAE